MSVPSQSDSSEYRKTETLTFEFPPFHYHHLKVKTKTMNYYYQFLKSCGKQVVFTVLSFIISLLISLPLFAGHYLYENSGLNVNPIIGQSASMSKCIGFTSPDKCDLKALDVLGPGFISQQTNVNKAYPRQMGAIGDSLLPFSTCHEHHNCNHDHQSSWDFEFTELAAPMMMTETLPAGTYIIGMDQSSQGNDTRLRQAYGLAVHLLHAGVPLKWIIDPNKTNRTNIDFSASARRAFPNTTGYTNRDFRTGPIAIFPGFEAQAATVINSFGNNIRVFELQNATTVPVHSNLTHKPFVIVDEEENTDIHTGILAAAGLVDNTHYEDANLSTINNATCATLVTVPHNDNITVAERNGVKAFVRRGGNFLAQCAAVRGFQEDAPRVFTNAGFVDEPGLGNFLYDNPQEPSAQFEGNLPDEGGSLENFAFVTNPPGGTRIVHDSGDDFKAYTGLIDGHTGTAGGYVHYLGGHDYDGDIDADRYYLNAVLRSAEPPEGCDLSLGPVAMDDSGQIDCGNNTVTIDVLANDTDPLGSGLTVNLLGTGSNGTFVNNNDGTVTYTGNVTGFWEGDAIDYEACSGSVCSMATITITGSNPTENTISGTVFEDPNSNMNQDGGETGQAGITVDLYEDLNANGVLDVGEPLLESTNTSASGDYSFSINTVPTTTTSEMIATTKATGNYEDNDDEGYGSCDEIFIEEDSDFRGHVFVEFDLSSLPMGCTVNSANLRLVLATGHSGDNFDVEVRRVTNQWVEGNGDCDDNGTNTSGVTWLNRSTGTPWNTQGGDFASTVYGTFNGGDDDPNGTVYNIDVAALVNDWLNGTPNHGLVLIPATVDQSGGDDWFYIYSDDATAGDRPRLDVSVECVNVTSYVMTVDASTLPAGASFTTDNIEAASFTDLGQLDCDNDFGYFLNCVNDPTLTLSANSGSTCVSDAITVSGNIFGGSATAVTITENGAGSVTPGSTSSSPFSFTYTPAAGDAGNVVTITVTTNNPLGSPCVPVTETYDLTVNPLPTVSFTAPADRCIDVGIQIALGGGTPTGGTYSGPGVTDDGNGSTYSFDPSVAGVGVHTITYTFTDGNGCENSASDNIEVFDLPNVSLTLGNNEACLDETSVALTGGSPIGGTYSGLGVTGSTFNPSAVGVGSYTITYTFTDGTGCEDSATDDITVFDLPVVSFSAPADLCIDAGVQAGLGGGTPVGGVYSGPGVTDDGNGTTYSFDPVAAGVGVHTITYTFTDANGCENSATDNLEVFDLPSVSLTLGDNEACVGETSVSLTGGSPVGGTYSGPGVTGSTFNPSLVGAGTYTITYTFADGNGCENSATDDITVFDLPVVSFSAPADLCIDAGVQAGLGGGTPVGGVYSGPGITDDGNGSTYSFDPSVAGVGVHTITYTFTDANGCENSATDNLEVFDLPNVSLTLGNNEACVDETSVSLTGGSPVGGTYSGPGVTGSTFNPSLVGAGTYTITYTFTDGTGCEDSATDDITVFDLPVVSFSAPADLCIDAGVQAGLGGGTPVGGVYSGPGITDDGNGSTYSFDPSVAGVGVHTITYTFTDGNGCENSASDNIEVFDLPNVSLTLGNNEACLDETSVALTGGSPVGGTYSGPGVTGSTFNPSLVGAGTYTITYTFTDGTGCEDSATDDITVFDLPVVSFSAPADLCIDAGVQAGLGGGTPVGGVYSGPGVTDDGNGTTYSFDPVAAGVGVHTITYTFTDANGCENSATDNLEVFDLPPAPVVVDIDCSGGPGNGEVTVTSPVGAQYEYQLDGGTAQVSPVFSGVSQGSHTITVININTSCERTGTPFEVDCNCPNPPTVFLNGTGGSTCDVAPIRVSGNFFGGSATEVTLSHDGAGTLVPVSTMMSPFSFTYTPDASDVGTLVTITVTTDNPLGPPCMAASSTYELTV